MKTLLLAILSLCFCPERRRRSLAGRSQSGATEDSGGRGGSADNHHGHGSGRWRQIEVRHRPKSLECGQSGDP